LTVYHTYDLILRRVRVEFERWCVMPNQRHKDKVIMSVYIPTALKAKIKAEARRRGVPMSVVATEFYMSGLMAMTGIKADERNVNEKGA
jgi:hypothetical protein